jgi:hypothetical protein
MTSSEMFRSQQGDVEKTMNGGLEVKLLPFGVARLDWM